MSQTDVTPMAEAVAGLLADNTLSKDAVTGLNEEASAQIPFGVMVCQGTTDDGALLLNTSSAAMEGALKGISMFGHGLDIGTTGINPEALFSVLVKGRIYVLPEEDVAPGDPVRVRAVASGSEVKGAFRTSADSTDCVDISKFARWVKSADISAGEYAIVEIDMTMSALAVAD